MNNIEESERELQLKLASLKLENAKLKQQLEEQNTSSFPQICSNHGNECIALFNNGVCEDANSAFLTTLGIEIKQARRSRYQDFFCNQKDLDHFSELLGARREASFNGFLKANDTRIFSSISLKFPFKSNISRFLLVASDISDSKDKEMELQFEHDELNLIFNTDMIGIFYLDLDRVIRRANKRGAQIIGYNSEEEVIGLNIEGLHIEQERYEEFGKYYEKIFTEGKPFGIEYQFKRRDGQYVWTQLVGQGINKPDNPDEFAGTIWTVDDITERKKSQARLENTNAELKAYFENSMMGIMIVVRAENGERIVSRVNNRLVELVGYDSKDEIIGNSVEMFHVSRDSYEQFGSEIFPNLFKGGINNFEYEFKKKDGTRLWAAGSAQAVDTNIPPDIDKGVIFMYDDTTERKEDRDKLERANAELATYFNNSMVGVIILDENNIICRANMRMANILGYDYSSDIIGKRPGYFQYDSFEGEHNWDYFSELLSQNTVSQQEIKLRGRNSEALWVCVSGKAIDNSVQPDLSKGVVWVVEDITARKIAEQKLVELATIDELTAVNNRRNFLTLCDREVLIARRKKSQVGLLMIDLDYFKAVNDTYGHDVGDKTLRYFADVCKSSLRPSDIFGRIGGEEFAVLLPDTPKREVVLIAERLRETVLTAFESAPDGIPPMTISIGACLFTSDESLEEALKRSDNALYTAKDGGRNQVSLAE